MTSGKRIPPDIRKKYLDLRDQGYSRAEACRRLGLSYQWAKGFDRGLRNSSAVHYKSALEMYSPKSVAEEVAGPKSRDELCPEALRALDDIAYFARRYFGLVLQPFQMYETEKIMELASTPEEEYIVINTFPGSGKSTFHTLVLPAWLTARDRRIRGLIGSATDTQAKWYVTNLRDALTTPAPISASPDDKRIGLAVDAEGTLCGDFGRFQPDDHQRKWASDGFYVELPDGIATAQKEPTWSSFGRSSAFLGLRVPFAIWDDVYDPDKNRSADSRDDLKRWWSDVAEKRLEPGGLLILQMQRLDPDDICRYALDMGGTVLREGDDTGRKYHHILFKAHYPEHCKDDHGPDATPYDPKQPDDSGCLLYPLRMPWAKVESERQNNPNFEMVYQQADVSRARALVDRLWINGGVDPDTREIYPGCIDKWRDLCQIPEGLAGDLYSIVTADPSPTKYWAIEWWLVRHDGEFRERYLLDLHRSVMEAPDLLDWNQAEGKFTGIMESWQQRSIDLGSPITHWIVEQNAAQRFMLQYDHTLRWITRHGVNLIGHDTGRNKADPSYGVWTIREHYKYGRIRLPYRWDTTARLTSQKLVDELIVYPQGRTDDCVMAHWFMEWQLPRLVFDDDVGDEGSWRPSWLRREKMTA